MTEALDAAGLNERLQESGPERNGAGLEYGHSPGTGQPGFRQGLLRRRERASHGAATAGRGGWAAPVTAGCPARPRRAPRAWSWLRRME